MLQKLKTLILNILFPPHCVSCKKEGDFLCEDCLRALNKRKIKSGAHRSAEPEFVHMDGLIYALDYAKNPAIKAAIGRLKYKFTEELANEFGDLMSEKIKELNITKNRQINLIPVPLHKKRLNSRGFNQSESIARSIVENLPSGKAQILHLLIRTRQTGQQAKLNKKERHENLLGAFQMNTKIIHKYDPNQIYFLVDDVCTTGCTIENSAEILKSSGFKKVYGLVVARAFK